MYERASRYAKFDERIIARIRRGFSPGTTYTELRPPRWIVFTKYREGDCDKDKCTPFSRGAVCINTGLHVPLRGKRHFRATGNLLFRFRINRLIATVPRRVGEGGGGEEWISKLAETCTRRDTCNAAQRAPRTRARDLRRCQLRHSRRVFLISAGKWSGRRLAWTKFDFVEFVLLGKCVRAARVARLNKMTPRLLCSSTLTGDARTRCLIGK